MQSVRLVLAAWAVIALSACQPAAAAPRQAPPVAAVSSTPLPSSTAASPASQPSPSASATLQQGTPTILPTETPLPTPTLPPGTVRISFPGEGVEVIKTGQVAAGAFQSFVLEALQGQELMASLDSPNHDLVLGIYGSTDGTWLVTPSQSLSTFQAPIPESGEYVVEAAAATAGDSFTLSITLATTIVLQPGSALTITGTALEVPVVSHLLPIRAGQNLTLDLKSKSATTFLVLYGFQDGKFLLTLDRRATQFNGHLPASEDYVVQVVQGTMPADFTLTMKIG